MLNGMAKIFSSFVLVGCYGVRLMENIAFEIFICDTIRNQDVENMLEEHAY